MVITLFSYLLPIFQLVLPLYLVYRIWGTGFNLKANWALSASHGVLAIVALFVIFRWDMVIYDLRYWLYGVCIILIGGSFLQVKGAPLYTARHFRWSWGQLLEGVLLLGAIGWSVAGFYPDPDPVDLQYPLKGEDYFVIHGGETPTMNYHGAAAESQTYALDINQLNGWSMRAAGMLPADPGEYAIFGDPVYSPASGIVVQAADSLDDQPPPKKRPSTPAGNHVWIQSDSLYILMAHLKQGSLQVQKGDTVRTGQEIGRVGNTGNTTEPHLHLHAVTNPKTQYSKAGTRIYGGDPVPITFGGRFLIRNNTFSK